MHVTNGIASDALGLLKATFDDDWPGPATMDYLAAAAADRKMALRLVTGVTALARLLVGVRTEETGAHPADTLLELERRVEELLPGIR